MGAKGFKNSLKGFERKELKKKYDSVKFISMKSIIQYLATSTVIIFKEWWKSSVVEEWKEFFEKMKESKSSLTIIILENGMEKKILWLHLIQPSLFYLFSYWSHHSFSNINDNHFWKRRWQNPVKRVKISDTWSIFSSLKAIATLATSMVNPAWKW